MENIVRCQNAHSARSETDGNFIAHTVRLIHRTIKRFLPAHYADRGAKIREWLLIGRRRELHPHGSASKALKIIGAVRGLAVGRIRLFVALIALVFSAISIYPFDSFLIEYIFMVVSSAINLQMKKCSAF